LGSKVELLFPHLDVDARGPNLNSVHTTFLDMSSLFGIGGGSGGQGPSGSVNPQQIDMAVAELDMVTDVFNRLVASCHNKCINSRYAEADLNKGESVCVDRCVAKFFEVNKKVGERMQTAGANAQAAGGSAPSFGGL